MGIRALFISKGKESDTVARFITKEQWKKESGLPLTVLGDFKAEEFECTTIYGHDGHKRHVLVGLGEEKRISLEQFRRAASALCAITKKLKVKEITIDLSSHSGVDDDYLEAAILEGITLGQYEFLRYKKKEAKEKVSISSIRFISKENAQKRRMLAEANVLCDNTILVRDLVNDTSDAVNPLRFAAIAKDIARSAGLSIKVLTEKEITKEKMGLLLAVNRGSRFPPRVVILEHKGRDARVPDFALLGKGITFDSGGMNLKPSHYIEEMRMDMAGAATVLGIMKSISEQKVRKRVVGVMVLTENMIDSNSYKPGDVFVSHSGKTVEIKNTDAEGRLVLADAVSYTIKRHKPKRIIDLATLTGACLICLGEMAAGIVSNNEEMALKLQKMSHMPMIHERCWLLPSYKEAADSLKSKIADLSNLGFEKGYAGTITGGLFIGAFVDPDVPWMHIDIAGTGMIGKQQHYMTAGGTGFGVRLIYRFISED